MIYQESPPNSKMQESSAVGDENVQPITTTVVRQEATEPLSFIERNDNEHYSPGLPSMPSVCCRVTTDVEEIQQAGFYVRYLAEGAANVVFSIHPWTADITHRKPIVFCSGLKRERLFSRTKFHNKVLRISKGHAKTGSCEEILQGMEKNVRPLFDGPATASAEIEADSDYERLSLVSQYDDFLMNYEPITLTEDVVLELTNEIDEESTRKENLSIPIREQTGILLPDMTSKAGQSVTIEIKPKWLQQSPNAPRDAYRCRTCALEASRSDKDKKPTYVCPLQLLTANAKLVRSYVCRKVDKAVAGFGNSKPTADEIAAIVDRITLYLTKGKGHSLLQHLRRTQIQLDPKGIRQRDVQADIDNYEANLSLAMTMRDCSMYIKVDYSTGLRDQDGIECKLGDLDSKAAAKFDDWDMKEKGLINGGWYTKIDNGLERMHHEECLISAGWKRYVPHYW